MTVFICFNLIINVIYIHYSAANYVESTEQHRTVIFDSVLHLVCSASEYMACLKKHGKFDVLSFEEMKSLVHAKTSQSAKTVTFVAT